MRRFSKVVLWGGLVAVLSVGSAPAQVVSEIMRGAVNDVPTDMFNCGDGTIACGLSYRLLSAADPSDVNGAANPTDGIPSYRSKPMRYLSDSQTSANFPVAGNLGFGNEWYMLWDGKTGAGTSSHAGWYGTQSQKVSFSELGNSLSFNCLPVVAQEACFRALEVRNASNSTVRADGSALNNVGGISPIPCPTIAENGLSTITYSWEEATNSTMNDSAARGVTGYRLSVVPDPLGAQTDAQAGAGVQVASTSYGTTMTVVDRATLGATAGLVGSTVYSANLRLSYVGGKSSLYQSCNSGLTGVATLGAAETGDAPFDVDVTQAWSEIRVDEGTGEEFVVITLNFADDTVSKNLARYELFFRGISNNLLREVDIRAFPASASRNKAGVPVLFKFTSDFDGGDIQGLSSFDDATGRLQVVISASKLAAALGTNSAQVTGDFKVRSSRDTFDMGVINF